MTKHSVANWHGDAAAGVAHRGATTKTIGGLHGDNTNSAVADLLSDLGHNDDVLAVNGHGHLECRVDLGKRPARELNVDHRAGDGDDSAVFQVGGILGDGHRGMGLLCVANGGFRSARRLVNRRRVICSVEVDGESVLRFKVRRDEFV